MQEKPPPLKLHGIYQVYQIEHY